MARKAFSSKDAELRMFGNVVEEWTLSYGSTDDNKLNYSAGSKEPTSYSEGQRSHEATLMLGMADQVAMEAASKKAGYKSLLDVPPAPAVVTYLNSDQVMVQDVVTMKFQSTGRQIAENDTLRYEHQMFVTGIEYNKSL